MLRRLMMMQPTVFLISLTLQILPRLQLKHLLGRSKPLERSLRRRQLKSKLLVSKLKDWPKRRERLD